jgi:hypothetical protein
MRHPAYPLTLLLLGLALAAPANAQPRAAAPASAATAPRNPRLGLVHVDVMDLHAVRLPDRPPEDRELLSAADIADRYRRAVESGVGWHRWSMYWDLVERAGTDTWGVTDGMVARDVAHGLATLAVLQGNQPGVAYQAGAPEKLDEPAFLRADGSATDDPAEAAQTNPANRWARFIGAVVTRYRPGGELAKARGWAAGTGVRAWQIGNEPNLPGFWRGTPAEYARLLEVAYLVAKWLDPTATVIHGGIADDGNAADWYGRFADALKARAVVSPLPARFGYYFDKAAWHWYRSPAQLATGPDKARAILAAHGLPAKPLWVTELGVPVLSEAPGPCWDAASPGRVTTAEQAGFIWQGLAEALAAGAENVFLFQLYDDCGNGPASYDAFGLVRNHAGNRCWETPPQGCWNLDAAGPGSPRPAFAALQFAARVFAGARAVAVSSPANAGWRQAAFTRADGARVAVAWATRAGDQAAAIAAPAGGGTLYGIDADGNVTSGSKQVAAAGRVGLRLPGVTNRNGIAGRPILGGRPVILVTGGGAIGLLTAPSAVEAPAPGGAAAAPGAPAQAPAPLTGGRDRVPPALAWISTLPVTSPPRLDLTLMAGDADSGLGAYEVYAARGPKAPGARDWQRIVGETAWPGGNPRTGQVRVPFTGKPGETWFFAARVRDKAGNWSARPTRPQAGTVVVEAAR